MKGRYQLAPGMRVYVACAKMAGVVSQVGQADVAVYFPKYFVQGPRVFLWDDGIVPIEPMVERFLGATYESLGIERNRGVRT